MAKTREEKIAELKAKRDETIAEYKAKIAEKKAEYDKRIKAAAKPARGGGSDRKRQTHLKIVGFGAIMKMAKNDETGKEARRFHQLFKSLAEEPGTPEKVQKDYLELAKLFEGK